MLGSEFTVNISMAQSGKFDNWDFPVFSLFEIQGKKKKWAVKKGMVST